MLIKWRRGRVLVMFLFEARHLHRDLGIDFCAFAWSLAARTDGSEGDMSVLERGGQASCRRPRQVRA